MGWGARVGRSRRTGGWDGGRWGEMGGDVYCWVGEKTVQCGMGKDVHVTIREGRACNATDCPSDRGLRNT